MKPRWRLQLALYVAVTTGCSFALAVDKNKTSIQIVNASSWSIDSLYLSPSKASRWGPDQLEGQALESGEFFALTDVDCGRYDVRLVDEDGGDCVIEGVDLCGKRETWQITDDELLSCEAATE